MVERSRLHTAAVGLSWRSAPAELRDRCYIPPEEVQAILSRLRERGIEEVVLLSTCNRVEFWMACSQPTQAVEAVQEEWERLRDPGPGWRGSLHVCLHEEAVSHVFRVTSSVDSLVLGETQIPSQVLLAWGNSREGGHCGWFLGRMVQAALASSKKVRSRTQLGEGATSVAGAAVDLARKVVGQVSRQTIAVVGAGEMAELAVTGFVRAGGTRFVYVNRTSANAERIAKAHPGRVEPLENLGAVLAQSDVVVSATAAQGFVITRDLVEKAMHKRRAPLFLLDIAAPRDIDPLCAKVDGVFLYGIDDLEEVVDRTRRSRGEEARLAESILLDESRRFADWVRELSVIPLLSQVREAVHETARIEVERFLPRLLRTQGSAEAQSVLEDFAQALANKFLHQPTRGARRAAAEGREPEIAAALRELFFQEFEP